MTRSFHPGLRRCIRILGFAAALALSACGGGGGTDNTAAQSPQTTAATTGHMLEAVSTTSASAASSELVQNGSFDNGFNGWVYGASNVSLVSSELRPGGYAMNLAWYAYQVLAPTLLQSGKSYTLSVTAKRVVTSGDATVAIVFKDTAGNAIASYKQSLTATSYQPTTIVFSAPAYAKASIAFETTGGARVIIDSVSLQPYPVVSNSYTVSATELIQNGDFSSDLTGWGHSPYYADILASSLRPGGKVLSLGWYAYQALPASSLEPGKSYALRMMTKTSASDGQAKVSFNFRDAQGNVFRSYARILTNLSYAETEIDFTVPAYAARAGVSFEVSGGIRLMIDTVSLKMRSAIPQTEPISSLAGSYVPSGYALAFNDEFDGNTLDRDKWFTRFLYGADRLNDEQQRYRDNDNHEVANGVLKLIARKVSTTDPQGINYESGMIRSDWTTRYGYFEARVKMPPGVGLWPAFWLVSDVSVAGVAPWPPEIDIFEFANNGVEDLPNMLHTGVVTNSATTPPFLYTDPAFNTQWTYYWAPFNFTDDWHTIGAEWTPDSVTTYIDGKKIVTRGYTWTDTSGQPAGPAHILLNLAVGGQWAGRHGIDDSAMPAAFQIDWVRAYTKID